MRKKTKQTREAHSRRLKRGVRATKPKMSDQEYYEYVTDCQNGYGHLWRK